MMILALVFLLYILTGVVAMSCIWLDCTVDDDKPRVKIITLMLSLAVSPLWPAFVWYRIKIRRRP